MPRDPVEFTRRNFDTTYTRVGNQVIALADDEALRGRAFSRWVYGINPGAAQIVLVNATLFYNLQVNEHVMITQYAMELLTLNDNVAFEIGYTDAPNGGGNFTALTVARFIRSGAAFEAFNGRVFTSVPPLLASYGAGARSITFRVDCNDALCQITPSWRGYTVGT